MTTQSEADEIRAFFRKMQRLSAADEQSRDEIAREFMFDLIEWGYEAQGSDLQKADRA